MSLSRFFRQIASGDSIRHEEGEFDLNLSYITPQIIAMGFPASGVEGMFRNSIVDVSQFLNEKHGGNYMIWNLSERKYDYSLFNNQVLDFGFPDHHNPPLLLLLSIVQSIHSWLCSDPCNVAVVHCLAGKGRTGTIIACYLLYINIAPNPGAALEFYASQRSHIQKGVTRPSQRQYVEYFYKVCFEGMPFQGIYKRLTRIQFGPCDWLAANGGVPHIEISQIIPITQPLEGMENATKVEAFTLLVESPCEGGAQLSLAKEPLFVDVGNENQVRYYIEANIVFSGDIVVRCSQMARYWGNSSILFRTSLHSAFVGDIVVLKKPEIGLADRDIRFGDDFALCFSFEDVERPADYENISSWTEEACTLFFAAAKQLREDCQEIPVTIKND